MGGTIAHLYVMHANAGGHRNEIHIWVAARTGLMLRQEVDLVPIDSARHESIRFNYADLQPPAHIENEVESAKPLKPARPR